VKPKLLFVLKLLGFSAALFYFWHYISQVYINMLTWLLLHTSTFYGIAPKGRITLYNLSLTVIPFISLLLATPRLSVLRRISTIIIGLPFFMLADFLLLRRVANALVGGSYTESLIDIFFLSIKWALPCVIWIVSSYPYIEDLYRPGKRRSSCYSCPVCMESHADIIDHIKKVHGKKALKKENVKSFISKNPQLLADSNPPMSVDA
jgi:hypothetical protein